MADEMSDHCQICGERSDEVNEEGECPRCADEQRNGNTVNGKPIAEHNPDETGYKAAAEAVRRAEEDSDFALPDADTVARVAIDAYRAHVGLSISGQLTEWAQAQLDIDEAHRDRDSAWLAVETQCTDDYLIARLHQEMAKAKHHHEQETILAERCEASADRAEQLTEALKPEDPGTTGP